MWLYGKNRERVLHCLQKSAPLQLQQFKHHRASAADLERKVGDGRPFLPPPPTVAMSLVSRCFGDCSGGKVCYNACIECCREWCKGTLLDLAGFLLARRRHD